MGLTRKIGHYIGFACRCVVKIGGLWRFFILCFAPGGIYVYLAEVNAMARITSWGKYPVVEGQVRTDLQDLDPEQPWIPRGLGRSYGDSALAPAVLSSQRYRRMLQFDPDAGILTCEAGVTYADLLTTFVPRGWFPPVTPGTKFVTLGGAIASDVHGKNHHKEGSITDHVLRLQLRLPEGTSVQVSREQSPELFWATVGGMGLTGFIESVTLQLKSIETAAIRQENIKAPNLETILALFDEFETTTYSVAWIDTLARGKHLGRSILMKGEHASLADVAGSCWEKQPLQLPKKRPLTVPFDFPSFVLNPLTVGAFNWLYYHKQFQRVQQGLQDYDSFFYPLDFIHHWNRIYGRKGFTQYQFVVPRSEGPEAIREVLHFLQRTGLASFLSVLKLLGPGSGYLSFPMEGYTLTLDFPIKESLFPKLDQLDEMVAGWGGRIYLTKDVRVNRDMLARTYPNLSKFLEVRKTIDPQRTLRSLQAERLQL